MAKVVGNVREWAENATFSVGDYIGSDTKVDGGAGVVAEGFVPGDIFAPTAEETNHEFNMWTRIMQWVQDGTSAGVAEHSIVERNDHGEAFAQRFVAEITGSATGPAISGSASNGSAGVYGESDDSHGVVGVALTGSSGYGVRGEGQGLGAGGVYGQGTTTGYGVHGVGGHVAAGVRGDGGAGGSPGGIFFGTDGEPDILLAPDGNLGLQIMCAAGAIGGAQILANGQLGLLVTQDDPDTSAVMFWGDTLASSGVATVSVLSSGAGDSIDINNTSSTGYCVVMRPEVSTPTHGAMRFVGQSARPSSTESGQLTYLVSETQLAMSCFEDFGDPGPGAGWRGLWTSIGGFALGYQTLGTVSINGGIDVWKTAATITAEAGNAPKLARSVLMRVTMNTRSLVAGVLGTINVRIVDVTNSNTEVFTRTGAGISATSGFSYYYHSIQWEGHITFVTEIQLPSAGNRTWQLDVASATSDLLAARHVSIDFLGVT